MISLRDLATSVRDGTVVLDNRRLGHLDDDEIIRRLSTVKGIGPWSSQLFIMFQLRRPDVWPVGDLGIRRGYGVAYGVPTPTEKELEPLGERFRPYRTTAAWYCWMAEAVIAGRTPDPADRRRPDPEGTRPRLNGVCRPPSLSRAVPQACRLYAAGGSALRRRRRRLEAPAPSRPGLTSPARSDPPAWCGQCRHLSGFNVDCGGTGAVGLVGAGHWADVMHGPTLAAGPETTLVGVWARRAEAATGWRRGSARPRPRTSTRCSTGARRWRSRCRPTSRPTWPSGPPAAGKALLLEKPVALTVADAERVAEGRTRVMAWSPSSC